MRSRARGPGAPQRAGGASRLTTYQTRVEIAQDLAVLCEAATALLPREIRFTTIKPNAPERSAPPAPAPMEPESTRRAILEIPSPIRPSRERLQTARLESVWYRVAGLVSREQKDLAVDINEEEIRSAQQEVWLEAANLILTGEPIAVARHSREMAERTIRLKK